MAVKTICELLERVEGVALLVIPIIPLAALYTLPLRGRV